ncbi:MAG: NAD-dependent epimerase/dehydratase [Magnetovibrio sp.]|nr:NAD-dependent epimerase/dehydratase [Magnetovibrio sp.]
MDFLTDPFLVDKALLDDPILVTGAGGCIGSWVLAILSRSGVSSVAFDLSEDRRRPSLVMDPTKAAELIWETGDIADGDALRSIVDRHSIRSIIHLAGLQVPFCKADPAAGARVNVEGTINVLEAARNAGIKRTVYASSVAALAMPPGGAYMATLYGAYKLANEYTAKVYWQDWEVPSIGIRPNIVYGIARDQGMTSKCTVAMHAAVIGKSYEIPYSGPTSWLYAGEAAAAFIGAVSQDGKGAYDFDLNGTCETVEAGMDIVSNLIPNAKVHVTGCPLPFPPDLDDAPIRDHVGDYPNISVDYGIAETCRAFQILNDAGRLGTPAV